MKTTLAIFATALVIAAASPALAAVEKVEVRVSHADLDLSKPEDVAELRDRINTAIEKACTIEGALAAYSPKVDFQCVKQARLAALAQLETQRALRVATIER